MGYRVRPFDRQKLTEHRLGWMQRVCQSRVAQTLLLALALFLGLVTLLTGTRPVAAVAATDILPPATADWTTVGPHIASNYGYAVSTAGDVNNDGYDDVLVGAYTNLKNLAVPTSTLAGKLYLYLGGSTGLSTTIAFSATGEVGDFFGFAVSDAGDVNNDGYDDFIVGAPQHDSSAGITDTGEVYVYLGQMSGVPTLAFTATGTLPGEQLGYAVGRAGDVNNDNYDDIIIGAWNNAEAGADAGKAFVYLGAAGGIEATPVFSATGEAALDGFGYAVNTAGDVNGDGYDDIIIGAWHNGEADNEAGKIYVYHGNAGGVSGPAAFTATGQSESEFGAAVSTAGDVNGDGYADVIVGAYRNSENGEGAGKGYLYHGSPNGLVAPAAFTVLGEEPDDDFGFAVDQAGDVNGDGFDDIVIGALQHDTLQNGAPVADSGKVYLYSGCVGGLLPTPIMTATGEATFHRFGRSVSTAGDVNHDGLDDLLVGAFGFFGQAYVYLGAPDGCRPALAITRTVTIDSVDPDCLNTTDSLHVPISTTVVYCYQVQNVGSFTLTHHSLHNSAVGPVFTGLSVSLAVGEVYTQIVTRTLYQTTLEQSTWIGELPLSGPNGAPTNPPGKVLSTSITASNTVQISGPNDDQDGDTIADNIEGAADDDNDKIPNFLDNDADNDGYGDKEEAGDDPAHPEDKNNNGQPGYLDPSETPTLSPAILLTKTVRVAVGTPGCGAPSSLLVPLNAPIEYCYIVQNTGNITLTTHTLTDNALGELLSEATISLGIGEKYTVTEVVTVTAEVMNTATWQASVFVPGPTPLIPDRTLTVTAEATATIRISGAEDDQDGDGIGDNPESAADEDMDGIPNYLDDDSDNDGIPDRIEGDGNPDNDQKPNYLDTDSDNDGFLDREEAGENGKNPADEDGNDTFDFLDANKTPSIEDTTGLHLPLIRR